MKKDYIQMKNWNIDMGSSYFPISAINFLFNLDDTTLRIGFSGAQIDLKCRTKIDRNKTFDLLRKWMNLYAESQLQVSKKRTDSLVESTKFMKKHCKD